MNTILKKLSAKLQARSSKPEGRVTSYKLRQRVQRESYKKPLIATLSIVVIVSSSFVPNLFAGGGAIEHYSTRLESEHTTTTTGWSLITESSVTADSGTTGTSTSSTGWIDSSNLTAGDKYLIMAWGSHNNGSASQQAGLRVVHGSNLTSSPAAFTESQAIEEADSSNAAYKHSYFWFTVWTAVSGEDIGMEIYRSGNTSRAEDISLVMINVDQLITDGDFQYDIDTTGGTLTTTPTAKSGFDWSPGTADDTWWVMGYVQGDTVEVGGDELEFRLNIDGSYYSAMSIEGEDNSDTQLRGLGWAQTFPASLRSVDVEISESGPDQEWDASGVFALNLNVFEDFAIATDATAQTFSTSGQWDTSVTVSPNPTTAGDWLIAAGAVHDDNGNRLQSRIQVSSTSVTDEVGGDSRANPELVPTTVADMQIGLTTGSKTIDYQGQIDTAGSADHDDAWLVAFSMEQPATDTYDQSHFRWRDDSTALNTDGGWLAAEDSNAIGDIDKLEDLRLRVEIDNDSTNNGGAKAYRLEWATKSTTCSAATGWTRVDTASDDWAMITTTHYTNGAAITTSRLTGDEATFVIGEAADDAGDDTQDNITLAADEYTEVEWAIEPTSNATDGQTYCFRVTDSGSTLNTYSVYPEATISNPSTFELLTQEGYIFENDDGSAADTNTQLAGSEFSSGKTLTSVAKGERITLRTHITNSGGSYEASDELALFYDRNDGIWTKVKNQVVPDTDGSGCADADWTCEALVSVGVAGGFSSMALDIHGNPWIAYYDDTSDDLGVATFVGQDGNCDASGGSDAWNCTTVEATDNVGADPSIAIDSQNNIWISYRKTTGSDLKVANFVGSGGNCDTLGGSDAWQCDSIQTADSIGQYSSIAFTAPDNPIVSYYDNDNANLMVATYTGTGTETSCQTGGSADWDCVTVDDTNNVGSYTHIAVDRAGDAWVTYRDNTNGKIEVAKYLGSGGDCDTLGGGSDAWDCDTIAGTNNFANYTSISFDPSGDPWVSLRDNTDDNLEVAKYTGSGTETTCAGGSADWDCTSVDETDAVGFESAIAFDANGSAWVSYRDQTNQTLELANYVGSGGNCDTVGSGSDAWDCRTISPSDSDSVGTNTSIISDADGKIWITHTNITDDKVEIARYDQGGEITVAPSVDKSSGDNLSESHADMTSATDTTGRDDTDCLAGSTTWNNGEFSESENLTGLVIADGQSTKQCTEVSWVIDTSQAVYGTTYRFVVASKDATEVDRNVWRGPISVATDGYPTLTISDSAESVYRYSKDVLYQGDDSCDNFDVGTNASADWQCAKLFDGNSVGDGDDASLSFAPDGTPWVAFQDVETGGTDIIVAKYVESGGDCDDTGQFNGGSDAWDCERVIEGNTGLDSNVPKLIFDHGGVPWFIFADDDEDFVAAHYVGSGGDCDDTGQYTGGSDAWECDLVASFSSSTHYSSIVFDNNNHPHVVMNYDLDVMYAKFVGTGGDCDDTVQFPQGGSDAWDCELVFEGSDTLDGNFVNLELDLDGIPWLAFTDVESANGSLVVAKYVGSGGDCDDTGQFDGGSDAWECTRVFSDSDTYYQNNISLTIDQDGDAWVSFDDWENPGFHLITAEYVGSGGDCDDTGQFDGGSDAWECTIVYDGGLAADIKDLDIVFDNSGSPWVAFIDAPSGEGDELIIARLATPHSPLSEDYRVRYQSKSAGKGDFRYRLDTGRAPAAANVGTCAATADNLGYCGVFANDSYLDEIVADIDQKPIYGFATRYSSNTEAPSASVYFQTSLSPATNNLKLQVYRFGTTNAWEDVATYSTAGCSTSNCVIEGNPSGTPSEYFEAQGSEYWVYYRLYQEENTSAAGITLKIDSFRARQSTQKLRHGRDFSNNLTNPFDF